MTKTGLFLLFAVTSILILSACEKDHIEVNETYIQNYSGKKDKEHKVKLCVQKGNGDWHGIEVSKSSEETHLSKGAMHPGDCMEPGKKMNKSCKIINVVEIANNNIDDDCDGYMDCEDTDLAKHDACNKGCSTDIILATNLTHKSIYASIYDPVGYSTTLMNDQLWAIQYCDNYKQDDLENWRVGSVSDYSNFEDKCGVYRPSDERPYGLPGIPIMTSDVSMTDPYEINPYLHGDVDDVELPEFYTYNNSSSAPRSFLVLCVHDE